jgi:hypothetical protein
MTTALRPPRDLRAAPEFAPFEHPAWLSPLARLIPGSPFLQHVPFGMYLVDAVRPRLIVELGTAEGQAYTAFCQTIHERGLPTRAWAFDEWRRADVLDGLRAFHDPRYGSFSRLIHGPTADAPARFDDAEVDLLHFARCEDLETLHRDFSRWLPKLGRRGLVLLTGTQARDSVAARFWSEAREAHPSFELTHGSGLGLLAVGSEVPAPVRALVDGRDEVTSVARAFFFLLGQKLALEGQLEESQAAHQAQLKQQRELMAREQVRFRQLGAELLNLRYARHALATQLDELRASFTFKLARRAWAAKDLLLQRLPATRKLYVWLEERLRTLP